MKIGKRRGKQQGNVRLKEGETEREEEREKKDREMQKE